nr:transglycosylase SLT domain-containing protein [Saccharibacter sp. 17.LH.SD]
MGRALKQTGRQDFKESVTPLPALKPRHGFRLNPALVYAVARMESNFDAGASSAAGAYGMMQIMPKTASFVTAQHIDLDSNGIAVIPVPPDMVDRLKEAGYNLDVGQLYLKYLAEAVAKTTGEEGTTGGDLLRVLASYNAGPQAIVRWEGQQKERPRDPLYYMESLPNSETRQYVHNVLLTSWLYGSRMDVDSPSLAALSEGRWPTFQEEELGQDSPS